MTSKMIYNSPYVGGELEIVTESPHPSTIEMAELTPVPVIIRYHLNGEEITRHEAQALLDEAKRRAAH